MEYDHSLANWFAVHAQKVIRKAKALSKFYMESEYLVAIPKQN